VTQSLRWVADKRHLIETIEDKKYPAGFVKSLECAALDPVRMRPG
jgi:hypothetical protein